MCVLSLITALILSGCASSSGPVPPPSASTGDYSQWTTQQLQMKIASYKRELSSDVSDGSGGFGAGYGDQLFRNKLEDRIQGMEAELLKRDPSGALLNQSGSM